MTQDELLRKLKELRSMRLETEVVEFKEANNNYDFNKLGKYFSALCNEANLSNKPEAWLVFGIKDSDKSLINTKYRMASRKLQSLKGEIANKTTSRITFIEIHEIEQDDKRVVMFQIPPAPKGMPIAWEGHYYGRDGEELGALNPEEFDRIRGQLIREDWSSKICKNATINDLDQEAISIARENFKSKYPEKIKECNSWDDMTFLNKSKITINGRITNTAIILLGKPESEHHICPAIARISWILKDQDSFEKDYMHYSCPFLLNANNVFNKIRNSKYRYMIEGTIFPEEIDQYEPYVIREALNNCIAHQDYSLAGKINVVEKEEGILIFSNVGSFIPGTVENVIIQDAPQSYYRNPFLAQAMVNLKMIDTIGSGIKKMFSYQSKRFFPMPDYECNNQVTVTITGKILNWEYSKVLAQNPDLSLSNIIALDKIQKNLPISNEEIKQLRDKKLIEGRKPNFYISVVVAEKTGQQGDYIKQRGIDDEYCRKVITDYLKKFKKAKRSDLEEILLEKLPDVLDKKQKKDKVKNNLQVLRRREIIRLDKGNVWVLNRKY